MSFRKIQPFADSSGSNSLPSQSTSESTSSDPRRAGSAGAGSTGKEADGGSSSSRRRRPPDSLTRNACTNCKKARAKCDGKRPCARCASRADDAGCLYEVHVKHAKEELVGRINDLDKQVKNLRSKNHLTEQILTALVVDAETSEILRRLKNDETYDSIVGWLGRKPMHEYDTSSTKGSQHSPIETSDEEMGGLSTTFRWTKVTTEDAILDHLFQLYFAWVHPVHTLFSEGHFSDSYQNQSYRFCSPTLVNAVCAMACNLHTRSADDEIDFEQLGRKFSEAARTNINAMDRSLTSVQAFAVLFLVESARGKCLRASSYLQIATHNLSHIAIQDHDSFCQPLRDTTRGIQCLNIEWAQITFQVPTLPRVHAIHSDDSSNKLDEAQWYFYRYVNDECPAWPSFLATVNREKAKLCAITYEALLLLYGTSSVHVQAYQVLHLYAQYLDWRMKLPAVIGTIEKNRSQALPHVLSLLIQYSNSVVQLLRPLLDFDGFPSETVEDVIWKHAQEGLFLLDQHYRTQYTCRYQPVVQMFAALHLCDVIARSFSGKNDTNTKDGPEAIIFGLECLLQSHAGFHIAGPLQELLRRSAIEYSIRLTPDINDVMALPGPGQRAVYELDDFIDACTRASYIQPIFDIQAKYSPRIATEWATEAPACGFLEAQPDSARPRATESEEERGAQNLMRIRNLLNQR
ncbi:MAG: hypothetical protein M1818_003652 [Claussenomyces sp. TS43310]|nr:MAG: hypothetical protein M1818_003652 [Claussenomyces sp. TS43310]